jgi:hypothetical protein
MECAFGSNGCGRGGAFIDRYRSVASAMVHKVGAALWHVATIRQVYDQRGTISEHPTTDADQNNQTHEQMLKAINDQGLSLQQYQHAMQMAQADPTLRQRVISSVQETQA